MPVPRMQPCGDRGLMDAVECAAAGDSPGDGLFRIGSCSLKFSAVFQVPGIIGIRLQWLQGNVFPQTFLPGPQPAIPRTHPDLASKHTRLPKKTAII